MEQRVPERDRQQRRYEIHYADIHTYSSIWPIWAANQGPRTAHEAVDVHMAVISDTQFLATNSWSGFLRSGKLEFCVCYTHIIRRSINNYLVCC